MRLTSCLRSASFMGLVAFAAVSARAQLPTGAQVAHGEVNIAQAANAMTITQASRHAIVNWRSFNLGAENTLRLQQTGADAAMLARVVGNDPSRLLGSLQADGKLFLINPHGIVVGQGAVIDTAAFLASTLDVSDDQFLRGGELTLKGGSAARIVNLGQITAREGNVMLFAHTVKNAGEINAPKGTAALGAGTEVYLAAPDTSMFVIRTNLPATTEKTGVENSGVIAAAQAQLEAAGGSLYELAVNQSGVVRATGSEIRDGRVLLTASGGTVGVSGEISARNDGGSGGEILVGGDYRGQNAAIANAARTVVTATGKLDASAASDSAAAGRVVVWADDATRFLGTLNAQGQGGGFAEVSGKRWLDFNPASTVQLGLGGTLLLDPDALVISTAANSGTSTSGADPFTFGVTTEPATLNVTTLQNQLAAANVILDTSTSTGDITFNNAVTWVTANALTVKSGNNINLNADITGGAGSTLALYTGRMAMASSESSQPDINGEANLDSAATITVGTLIYGANGDSDPGPGYTLDTPLGAGTFFADGNLKVGVFELDLNHGSAGITTDGADNTIGAFRTSGDADFSAYVVNHHGDLDLTLHSTQVDGGYLQFITPGNLTLKSGSDLTFTSPGSVILASTAGAFVNEAGADVFGTNARYFIYTSTTAATSKGGLTGAEVFNHPYSDADDYTGLSSTFFFSGASGSPILTYTADSFIRRYGAANPAFTYTVAGWLDGVTNDVAGAPALSAAATQSSGVGSYDITITAGTLASSNYDFSFEPGTLSITRAPLTITAANATRRIGVANPDF
ncbi:MAG: filamentous hemagglutinin N-terminal domain-containing protein, partial [Opitutaceae bacterium]|nr:filamentous hemagglutinin N-terminal domain-containing protein [Opitutaceae bacterium]